MVLESFLETLTNNAIKSDVSCLLPFLALLTLSTSSLASDNDGFLEKAVSKPEKFVMRIHEFSTFLSWLAVLTSLTFVFLSIKLFVILSWFFALITVCSIIVLFARHFGILWFFSVENRENNLLKTFLPEDK